METKTKPAKGTEDREIVVTRVINAPRKMVYKAFTDPKQLAQWWAPLGFNNKVCNIDLRIGGKWLLDRHGLNGQDDHKFYGEYKEIIENERLVYTFIYDGYPDTVSVCTITLEDKEGKTLLTAKTLMPTPESCQGMRMFGFVESTNQIYGRLEEFLTKSIDPNRTLLVTRVINAPRELVWEAWTNPEHIKHWWGPSGFTNTIYKMDVKEGGDWEFTMHAPDGRNFDNTNTFKTIIKNEKLILVHVQEPVFSMEVWFVPQGDKTMITIRNYFQSVEVLQRAIKEFGAEEGLKQNIERLANYVPALPKERELVIMRQFNAPRELVFKMLTEATHLAKWWGPKGLGVKVHKLDVKPGGMFLYSGSVPNGPEMWGKFIYREIQAPEKLVFVNSFSDKDGGTTPNPFAPGWPLEVMNTITLTEHDGKTTLLIKGKPINATAEQVAMFEANFGNMNSGFAGTFDQLDEYLASLKN
jgi:uncharacterized protein YndB with AHSA1/START domain